MIAESRQAHWETVYTSKGEREVSWFQENPAASLDLIAEAGANREISAGRYRRGRFASGRCAAGPGLPARHRARYLKRRH